MKIMAIDLGDTRTGLAICDKDEILASPVKVITEKNKDRLLDKIIEEGTALGVEMYVVGYPKNMNNTVGERAQLCLDFADKLREKSNLPVDMRDERCTTVSAHNILNVTNTRGKKRKAVVDAVAAVIILQDYIDYRKNIGADK
jgi:putative Holliday junction resolvase